MRAKWSAPIRKYWKISEQMMVKYCDLTICDSVNIEKYIHDMAVRLLVEQVISKMENLPDEQFNNLELDLYRPDAPEEEKA